MAASFSHSFGRRILVVWILTYGLCCPLLLRSQLLQGTINGNVTDSSQAALVGAKVIATDQATGLVRDSTSASDGVYALSAYRPVFIQ